MTAAHSFVSLHNNILQITGALGERSITQVTEFRSFGWGTVDFSKTGGIAVVILWFAYMCSWYYDFRYWSKYGYWCFIYFGEKFLRIV